MIFANFYKYLSIVMAISIAGLSLFSTLQQHQIKAKDETIINLNVKVSTALTINQDLNEKINLQNNAVKELSNKSIKLQKRLALAKRDAESIKTFYDNKVTAILTENIQNDCRSSLNWLKSKATDLR